MESNQAFNLEADSPADREAKRREARRVTREATARARAAARAAGMMNVYLTLPGDQVNAIDAFQRDSKLANRSAAAAQVIAAGLTAIRPTRRGRRSPDTNPQFVSVPMSPESLELVERVKAARGLATESEAFAAILAIVCDNPQFIQEKRAVTT